MLTKRDQIIVSELRKNSREKLSIISSKTGIPISTVHERLHRLVKERKIRLVSLPYYEHLHLPLQTWMFIKTKDKEGMIELLQMHPNINTVLLVNNGVDIVVEGIFRNYRSYQDCIDELNKHGKVQPHPVIEEIAREKATISSQNRSYIHLL